jgi:glutamate/tyrosine decarboxylase-like PLP-dependent enzyme
MRKSVPKYELPDAPLPANVVKTLLDDEMMLDGNPRQVIILSVAHSHPNNRVPSPR